MKEYEKEIKMVENALVIIALFIIIIILYNPLIKIIDKVKLQSAEESTLAAFNMTKNYYTTLNLVDVVDLPFKIVFDENQPKGYIIYSNEREYTPSDKIKLKIDGKLPTSGSIEIKKDGEVETLNLIFGKYICNKKSIKDKEECIKIG